MTPTAFKYLWTAYEQRHGPQPVEAKDLAAAWFTLGFTAGTDPADGMSDEARAQLGLQ